MSRWFRFYSEALRNPKVMKLSDKEFRLWVRLLALAAENEGHLPPLDDMKHVLSMRLDHLSSAVDRLTKGGLIDPLADGYEPHNWSKFQYKSDTSTERVTKHRAKRNVSETPPDTETEAEVPLAKANGAADPEKVVFDSGIVLLAEAGVGEAKSRPLIGRWKRDHGAANVIAALGRAQREGAIDPVAFIEGCLNSRRKAETYDRDRITV